MTIARLAEPHVMNLIGELVHVTIESTTTEYAFTVRNYFRTFLYRDFDFSCRALHQTGPCALLPFIN